MYNGERTTHRKNLIMNPTYLLPVCVIMKILLLRPLSAIAGSAALLCMHNEHEKYHILLQPPRYYTKFYKAAKNLKKKMDYEVYLSLSLSLSPALR
jgi:hypothetical protein